ncbi:MAG: TonB-dependent receptor, partial [Kofleriaceae bacterium]|nr:TonB-dependent receptor [Kofleriaceae bacterium]
DGKLTDGKLTDGKLTNGKLTNGKSTDGTSTDATGDESIHADSTSDETADEGETIEIVDKAPPGARAEVSKEQLERDEYDDLHKVLGHVAGVYIRDEDGYGLRPNIGMRGANADRSQKITLMEDGVLSGPAPYSAPAAYYVPLVTRMTGVEVTKGPSAILYGPATVGGAIDMISQPFPNRTSGFIDLAGGSDLYGKVHAMAAERREQWGLMAEYVHLRTDGFKDLDGGGDTGFDKDDVLLTGRITSKATATNYHVLSFRAQYGHETSNETYTGLTDEDFREHPQRRYIASQLDQMNWDHWTLRADHRLDLGLHTRIVTSAYRHKFHRAWGKVDGFVGMRDFYGLIAEPNAGANALYYAILTGQTDSSSPEEQLIRGTNDRYFTSQGIQSRFATEQTTGPLAHHVDAGVRFHFDRADRSRYEDGYDMVSGTLVRSDRLRDTVLDTRAETLAIATFAQDTIHYKRLEVSGGLRLELIDYRFKDWLSDAYRDGQYAVWIPGGGVEYHITDEASVLAGVHRGFVPVAPSAAEDVKPESSINYEAGARWRDDRIAVDVIGFYSDYSNLKGACTLSSGCMETQEGEEYNGGHVRVWGAEVQAGGEWPLARRAALTLPFAVAYTFTRSAFQHSFTSELAGWGDVEKGDELPYLPHHQIAVSAGAKIPRGEVGATVRYRGESRDEAGQGPIEEAVLAESLLTLDLSLHARLHPYAELYATCSNVFDEQVIISRRPYGARPNPPRMFAVGYKARF